jgi:hypothetical protein
MMARGDFGRYLGNALPHRSFIEAAVGALCSMIGWATDGTLDEPVVRSIATKIIVSW